MILRCTKQDHGTFVSWIPFALEDNKGDFEVLFDQEMVFMVSKDNGMPTDMRRNPPFYQILPCPFCGVETDRNHNPLMHVDDRLGTPVAKETQKGGSL